jgi:hypothetical protein
LGDDALVSRGGAELFRAMQIGRVDAVKLLKLLTFSSEVAPGRRKGRQGWQRYCGVLSRVMRGGGGGGGDVSGGSVLG